MIHLSIFDDARLNHIVTYVSFFCENLASSAISETSVTYGLPPKKCNPKNHICLQ